jgi:histidyl-tRNA synthetase
MKKIIQSLKGTRDYYPEEMYVRSWLYGILQEVSESFGYQEWEGPLIESINLYAAKSGEELVKKQSFVFEDRGGDLITLRPELTPTLARIISQRQRELTYPLRWWSFGPFWRYEKPQKGRTREFFQWNVDLIGVDTPQADAEVIAAVVAFFKRVGLGSDQVKVLVGNRALLELELIALDINPESKFDVLRWIDRRSKMQTFEWEAYGDTIGLHSKQKTRVIELLDNKELWKKSEVLVQLFQTINAINISDYVEYDPNIVRGLDYYTGTVFEAYEVSGDVRRSILGGGRYDNLMAAVGGDPLPATGFAMGDLVNSLILGQYNLLPKDINESPASVMVSVFDQERMLESIALSSELREAGLKVSCFPEAIKLPKQFKYADRMGIRLAIVIGPEEIESNEIAIKDLQSGQQIRVSRMDAVKTIRSILENGPSSQEVSRID